MPTMNELFPSKYLRPEDLEGRRVLVTMRQVETAEFGREPKELRAVLHLNELKPLILNKTNASVIAKAYGDDTDDWFGKKIVLYTAEVTAFGETKEAVRVALPNKNEAAPPPVTGRCPECNAPDGKMHATGCSRGRKQDVRFMDEGEGEEEGGGDDFDPYAHLFTNGDIQLPKGTSELILRVREWDSASNKEMDEKAYSMLAHLIDDLLGEGGEVVHGRLLSALLGRTIARFGEAGNRPSAGSRNLTMILNSPNKHQNEMAALSHLRSACDLIAAEMAA